MKKILITGGTGFIGRRLIQYFLEKNLMVRILTRNNQDFDLQNIEIFNGDLTKPDTLHNVCLDIDTVFHLGGYAHAWEESDASFAEKHYAINFLGTKNILKEAIRSQVKNFIYFSSVKAVGDCPITVDENYEAPPNSAYGTAKRQAEQLVLNAKNSNIHVCVLRPALVYGPHWKGNLAVMLQAIENGKFPPLPKIKNSRSMISIDDICHAAYLAANHSEANGKIYFITDGNSYSTYDIYALMCESLGKSIPKWHLPLWFFRLLALIGDIGTKLFKRRMPFNSDALNKLFGSAHYSSEKFKNELKFIPQFDLKKMLPQIVEQHRAQKNVH